jgi:hypothetical protein
MGQITAGWKAADRQHSEMRQKQNYQNPAIMDMSDESKTLLRVQTIKAKAQWAGVHRMLATLLVVVLTGCITVPVSAPYNGPRAPTQVVYRIDDNRYFTIEPRLNYACTRADLNYVDTKLGIRTHIPGWDRMEKSGRLFIDATNDRYLVAPIAGMDEDCEPGAHPAHCESFMAYSQDAGRTWQITKQLVHKQNNGDVRLVGDTVYYAGYRARLPDLSAGDSAWTPFPLGDQNGMPLLTKPSIDTQLQCDNRATIQD